MVWRLLRDAYRISYQVSQECKDLRVLFIATGYTYRLYNEGPRSMSVVRTATVYLKDLFVLMW